MHATELMLFNSHKIFSYTDSNKKVSYSREKKHKFAQKPWKFFETVGGVSCQENFKHLLLSRADDFCGRFNASHF
jgi:hypothetical protein